MKKFIINLIIITIPVLTILLSTNYFGDAAKLFDENYEKEIAKIIVNGEFATNVVNYDERLLQKELIMSELNPDVVVIGSSRAMQITSELFPNESFFNNSVSGARVEDLISLYQLYKINKKQPKKIIIGVDPWLFNDNRKDIRWESLSEYYFQFLNKEHTVSKKSKKYSELFSLSYFQSSLKSMPRVLLGKNKPEPTLKKENRLSTKLTDGSLVYGDDLRKATQNEIDKQINIFASSEVMYGFENFDNVSTIYWKVFIQLIEDMQKNNIEVEFFLSPYAPIVYNRIKTD